MERAKIEEANAMLKTPFSFYGQYLQFCPEAKNGHLAEPLKQRFFAAVTELRVRLEESQVMQSSYEEVVNTLTEKAKSDAFLIESL